MSCETLFLGILYFWLPLFKGSPPSHYSYLTFSTEVAGPLSSLLHSRLEAPAPTYALIPAGNSRVEAGPGSLPSPPPLTVLPPWSQCEGGGPAVLGNKRGSANLAKLPRSDQQWKNELSASSLYPVTEVSFHSCGYRVRSWGWGLLEVLASYLIPFWGALRPGAWEVSLACSVGSVQAPPWEYSSAHGMQRKSYGRERGSPSFSG